MSTYDNQLPRIPLEVLERVARMTDNITAALNTSGVLSACADLQRLTAQSLAASFEAHQRLSAALQPLLDYMAKLSEELPTPRRHAPKPRRQDRRQRTGRSVCGH